MIIRGFPRFREREEKMTVNLILEIERKVAQKASNEWTRVEIRIQEASKSSQKENGN